MPCVIFDFDSTLIGCESLEEILSASFAQRPELEEAVRAVTVLGMEGEIDFQESLRRRLALAQPTLAQVRAFGERAGAWLTPGFDRVIDDLRRRGVETRVVSGGLQEAIEPLAGRLGIPAQRVHAVRLKWAEDGAFAGIDPGDPFSVSKMAGVKPLAGDWPAPRIAVGDGFTDYCLHRDGFADHFIAFTQHVRRQAVTRTGAPEARNAAELARLLEDML